MQARTCPQCSATCFSSGWQGPLRLRCECGELLNRAEAQLDRRLLDDCRAVAEELFEVVRGGRDAPRG